MSAERVFLDANVIVYAHDLGEPVKRAKAMGILADCWAGRIRPTVSVQVLQEVHVTLVRKGLPVKESTETVSEFLLWNVIENRVDLFREALTLQSEVQLSFWDASILAAAQASGATELWSEDFQHGRNYGGVIAKNPFVADGGVG